MHRGCRGIPQHPRSARCAQRLTPDGLWIGTQIGLYLQASEQTREVEKFSGVEIRALLRTDSTVFVLTQQGLFALHVGSNGDSYRADLSAALTPTIDSIYATTRAIRN